MIQVQWTILCMCPRKTQVCKYITMWETNYIYMRFFNNVSIKVGAFLLRQVSLMPKMPCMAKNTTGPWTTISMLRQANQQSKNTQRPSQKSSSTMKTIHRWNLRAKTPFTILQTNSLAISERAQKLVQLTDYYILCN